MGCVMDPIFVGVDPGLDGAIVWRLNDVQWCGTPVPTTVAARRVRGKTRRVRALDLPSMSGVLADVVDDAGLAPRPIHVVIEHVAARPGQGVASMFNFGFGYGVWIGMLTVLGLPTYRIAPRTWKAELGLLGATPDEERAWLAAHAPAATAYIAQRRREKTATKAQAAGMVDAALLALYGAQTLT